MNDNKLIAEFMGVSLDAFIGFFSPLCPHTGETLFIPSSQMKYHTSWDWLMPVVSKCRVQSNSEDSHWEAVYYSLEDCDIDVTYKAVVKFIKTYNNDTI